MAGRRLVQVGILVGAAATFGVVSLWPWKHLMDTGYVLSFALFAAALCISAVIFAVFLSRLGLKPTLAVVVSALVVFPPAWAWNRVGPINVVLLHLDSFRADHSSSYGYERETTPNLDAFARNEALLFENFIAQSAGTDKSTPAMLAGIYPSMFYDPWSDGRNFWVPSHFPLLGEFLARHGYRALGMSSNPEISSARNYARGFDQWDEMWKGAPRAPELFASIQARIEETDEPFFSYGLILDPHLPYTPREPFDKYSAEDALSIKEITRRVMAGESPETYVSMAIDYYDGEILEVDDAVGDFLDWLRASRRMERTLVIVTSDHGEKFFEHGELTHGGTLFEEVLHVPLWCHFPSPLRFPALRPKLRRYSGLASHVDLIPTIMGYLGLPMRGNTVQGDDLTPFLFLDEPPPSRTILSEELVLDMEHRSLRSDKWKAFTKNGRGTVNEESLVDLQTSPLEQYIATGRGVGQRVMQEMLVELAQRVELAQAFYRKKQGEPSIDEETLHRLRELGYAR